jgi:hypothetical protein
MAAVAVFGFSFTAHAMSGEHSGASLLYTYYDTRAQADGGLGLTDNYITVTNTSPNWVQAHVRVRTGAQSVELLDFDILLSPQDVFAFDLFFTGETVFSSCDTQTLINSGFTPNFDRDGDTVNECYIIGSSTFPNMLSHIQLCEGVDAATALLETQKGYIEIIGEGVIIPNSNNTLAGDNLKANCDVLADGLSANDVAIAGRTLLNSTTSLSLSDPTVCLPLLRPMNNELIGRQYYGTVTGGIIQRLAQNNAEIMDALDGIILHMEDYLTEQARCAAVPGCYAYVAAQILPFTNGAQDINYCFYENTQLVAGDVINKFGAAATYGPTLVDIFTSPRPGTTVTTAAILTALSTNMSFGYNTIDGLPTFFLAKLFADSHYFALEAPLYDVTSSFAFIFPFQHYIAEVNEISIPEMYDMEENPPAVLDPGKFISPGLPSAISPDTLEEAGLFTLTDPEFGEGWIRFSITAVNGTDNCQEVIVDDCREPHRCFTLPVQ